MIKYLLLLTALFSANVNAEILTGEDSCNFEANIILEVSQAKYNPIINRTLDQARYMNLRDLRDGIYDAPTARIVATLIRAVYYADIQNVEQAASLAKKVHDVCMGDGNLAIFHPNHSR